MWDCKTICTIMFDYHSCVEGSQTDPPGDTSCSNSTASTLDDTSDACREEDAARLPSGLDLGSCVVVQFSSGVMHTGLPCLENFPALSAISLIWWFGSDRTRGCIQTTLPVSIATLPVPQRVGWKGMWWSSSYPLMSFLSAYACWWQHCLQHCHSKQWNRTWWWQWAVGSWQRAFSRVLQSRFSDTSRQNRWFNIYKDRRSMITFIGVT